MSSIRSCIAAAKLQLGIEEDSRYDPWLRLRAQHALRTLDNPDVLVKKMTDVAIDSNNRFYFPPDFYKEISIFVSVQNPSGAPLNPLTGSFPNGIGMMYYLNLPILNTCGVGVNAASMANSSPGNYQVNDNYIQFFGNFANVTGVTMCYLAWNVNEFGEIKVKDEWEQGVMYFLCWNYAMRYPMKYDRSIRKEYSDNWVAQSNWIKANSQLLLFKRMAPQIMEAANALITDKNIFFEL